MHVLHVLHALHVLHDKVLLFFCGIFVCMGALVCEDRRTFFITTASNWCGGYFSFGPYFGYFLQFFAPTLKIYFVHLQENN